MQETIQRLQTELNGYEFAGFVDTGDDSIGILFNLIDPDIAVSDPVILSKTVVITGLVPEDISVE